MDIGIVASRYAKALLRFAIDNKEENTVFSEMQRLDLHYRSTTALNVTLHNPTLTDEQKVRLLCAAANTNGSAVSRTTRRFLELVVTKNRTEMMPFIATSFQRLFASEKKMTAAQLSLATPISEVTIARLRKLVETRTGHQVEFQVKVDPALKAGFILEYDDYRMDASLRGQIARLRRELK